MPSYKLILVCCCFLPPLSFTQVPPPSEVSDSVAIGENVFYKVESEANFPGGLSAWRTFLEKNLNAATPVDNGAPPGIYPVTVKFIVSRDGTISDVEAETNMGYGTEKEVIRLIKGSGLWNPARQNGRTVNAYRRQPVTFLVEDDDVDIETQSQFIFFTGSDNPLNVKVNKVNTADLDVRISKGNITKSGDGKFNVRVTQPGRVIVTIYNTKTGKMIQEIYFWAKE